MTYPLGRPWPLAALLLSLGAGCTSKADDTGRPDSAVDSADDTGDTGTRPVDHDHDGYPVPEDCDDADATIHPDAHEHCDGVDEDCDGVADEDGAVVDGSTWYRDEDLDTYGDAASPIEACEKPDGYALRDGDCDDTDPARFPGNEEIWYDGIDEACDGGDDNDADGDGLDAYAAGGPDCDDTNPSRSTVTFGEDCAAPYGECDVAAAPAVLLVPGDSAGIQEAIEAATDGTLICVGPGTWTENLNFLGKAVKVQGALGPEYTVLDGGRDGTPIVSFETAEPTGAVLRGFTLTDGYSDNDGGAVHIYGKDDLFPSLYDLVITGNEAHDDGGGMYIHTAAPTMRSILIQGNLAGDSGGGFRLVDSGGTFSEVTFLDNIATHSGGAMAIRDSEPVFADVQIQGNYAGENGGGIVALDASATFTDVTFAYNEAAGDGGAMDLIEVGHPRFIRVAFVGNRAAGNGGAVRMYDGGQPDLLSVSFLANEAVAGDGGALYLDTVCGASVTNASFVGNHAACGTIALDGACADGTGPNLFSNLALHGNVGTTAGGVCIRNEGPLSLTWSDFSGNGVEFDGLDSPVGVDGNVDVDPGFVSFGPALDPSTWDLHLRADSLLRDIGDPSVTDADGSRADIGGFAGAFAAYDWYDDVDVDGLYDGWESAHGLDPTVNDADADGDGDGLDNLGELGAGTDPSLADTDGDGRTDGAEVLDGTDPLDPAR